MAEIWKDIPSYEGIYQVSNDGRVRTVEGKMTTSVLHGERHWHSRILKTKDTWGKDHKVWCGWRVTLWKDKQPKEYLVHRLEACTFLGYPLDTTLTVNHKDGNRRNNDIDNLEIITRGDNIRHGFDIGLYGTCIPVTIEDEHGNEYSFRSTSRLSTFLGKKYKDYRNADTVTAKDGTRYKVTKYGREANTPKTD